jgi:hypothetical protein
MGVTQRSPERKCPRGLAPVSKHEASESFPGPMAPRYRKARGRLTQLANTRHSCKSEVSDTMIITHDAGNGQQHRGQSARLQGATRKSSRWHDCEWDSSARDKSVTGRTTSTVVEPPGNKIAMAVGAQRRHARLLSRPWKDKRRGEQALRSVAERGRGTETKYGAGASCIMKSSRTGHGAE